MSDIHNEQGKRRNRAGWSQPGGRGQRTGGRGHGAGRGPERGEYVGFGRHRRHGFGGEPGFAGPGFRWGRKAGRGDVRAAILALLAEEPMPRLPDHDRDQRAERRGLASEPRVGLPDSAIARGRRTRDRDHRRGARVFHSPQEGHAAADEAGGQPAPWEEASRQGNGSLRDLGRLVGDVAQAMAQTVRAGTPEQVSAVRDILVDTRRRIYLVLADGPGDTDSEHSADE